MPPLPDSGPAGPSDQHPVHDHLQVARGRCSSSPEDSAVAAFACIDDDPALVVTVGTGIPKQGAEGRDRGDWLFVVNASWNAETGTPQRGSPERHYGPERRNIPDRRNTPDRRR